MLLLDGYTSRKLRATTLRLVWDLLTVMNNREPELWRQIVANYSQSCIIPICGETEKSLVACWDDILGGFAPLQHCLFRLLWLLFAKRLSAVAAALNLMKMLFACILKTTLVFTENAATFSRIKREQWLMSSRW